MHSLTTFNKNPVTMCHRTRGLILVLCTLLAIIVSAGAAALAQAAPTATDWTTISGNKANGTVQGISVELSGTQVWNTPTSRVDGSWPYFAAASTFSPALPKSDVIQITGAAGATYAVTFTGAAVKDPILHLGSLGSRIEFTNLPPGTAVTRLSSEGGFTVTGNVVTGTPSNTILASGNSDASGSVKLTGTFTRITFKADYPGPADGILVQLLGEAGTVNPPPSNAPCANADTPVTQLTIADAEAAVRCLTNEKRAQHGLPALASNATLAGTARSHADKSARLQWWRTDDNGQSSHDDPEVPNDPGATSDSAKRIRAAGYCSQGTSWAAAENTYTAAGAPTPRTAVDWWYGHLGPDGTVATNGHRKTMLSTGYRELGVGVAHGSAVKGYTGGATFVQHYGSCS